MNNVVMFFNYKLRKGVSVSDFLKASENLNNGYMSKQKGFISWKQLANEDGWADLITFETMEDVKKILDSECSNELNEKFYSFINLNSCKTQIFNMEKSYE
jgi:hypothetical protein